MKRNPQSTGIDGLSFYPAAAAALIELKEKLELLGLDWFGIPKIEFTQVDGKVYLSTRVTLTVRLQPPVSGVAPTKVESASACSKAVSAS